jgi:hypothetical protein
MSKRDFELAKQVGFTPVFPGETQMIQNLIDLIRADERADLIKFFDNHWRSDWSDGQIVEALDARGNT